MNMKKTLSLLTAAALSISSFAALAVTASADTPDYGTKTSGEFDSITFNVGADSIIYGGSSNGGQGTVKQYQDNTLLNQTYNLSDHNVNGTFIAQLKFQELTSSELSSFDTVELLVGCKKDRSAMVYVGETPVASFSNVNTGDWTKYESLTAELTSTNASGSVTLVITNPNHDENYYMGNYVTLKFYNRDNVTTYGSVYTDTSGNKIFGFNGEKSVVQGSSKTTTHNLDSVTSYSIPDSIQGEKYVAILQMHYVDLSKNNFGKAVICMGNGNKTSTDYTVTLKVGDTEIATFTNKNTYNSWNPHEQDEVNINNHTAKGYVTLTINHYSESYAGNYAYVKFIPRTEFSSSGEIAKGTAESKLSSTDSSYQRFTDKTGNPADAYMTSIDFNSQYAANGLKWCIYKQNETNHAELTATDTTFTGGMVYFGLVISGTEEQLNSITKVELK